MDTTGDAPKAPRIPMLLLLLAAVILVPLVLVFLSNSSFKSKSKASSCDLVAGCVDQNGACIGAAQTITVSGQQYSCRGNNQWTLPDGSVGVLPRGEATNRTLVGKELPVQITPETKAVGKGCIVSLAFVKDGIADSALKASALVEMNSLKNMFTAGSTCNDLLSLVKTGYTPAQLAEIKQKAGTDWKAYRDAVVKGGARYASYTGSGSVNFVFTDANDLNRQLGEFFFQSNPMFASKLSSLSARNMSEPFVVYTFDDQGNREFAWSMIAYE